MGAYGADNFALLLSSTGPLCWRTMITLDCENRDTALGSLSLIYGVSALEIETFLKETDLERHYAENDPQLPGDRELTLLFEKALACTPSAIDRVFWFHLTRVSHDADFQSGILPLTGALPHVWSMILGIFKGTEYEATLRKFRDNGVPNFHYSLKVGKPHLSGPYAMLVRDAAFQSHKMGNHDYLWLPEIVEDICNGYLGVSGIKLHDTVCDALIPYVVKFWSSKQTGRGCIESAMYYLYCTAHGQGLSINANTCFDGNNCAIPRKQIVKIEKIEGEHNNAMQADARAARR